LSEAYTVWWIDDELDSRKAADVLDDQSDQILIDDCSPEEVLNRWGFSDGEDSEITEDLDPEVEPDMVLIDWKLNRRSDFTGRGTSMLGIVRDHYGKIPIYGFSAEPEDVNSARFLRVFDLGSDLTAQGAAEDLIEDIDDFRQINDVADEGLDGLISTLNPPTGQEGELKPLIPRELSNGISNHNDGEIAGLHQFTEWVWKRFLHRPGLLLDDLWTATKLGLTKEAFAETKPRLCEAVDGEIDYTGVLSPTGDRWWKSQVIQAIINIDEAEGGDGRFDRTWKKGADLFAESEDDIARCKKCNELLPETVAAPSPNSNLLEPVHYRCSEIHHSRAGAFADFRIFGQED
jgi:hypothetical protein